MRCWTMEGQARRARTSAAPLIDELECIRVRLSTARPTFGLFELGLPLSNSASRIFDYVGRECAFNRSDQRRKRNANVTTCSVESPTPMAGKRRLGTGS